MPNDMMKMVAAHRKGCFCSITAICKADVDGAALGQQSDKPRPTWNSRANGRRNPTCSVATACYCSGASACHCPSPLRDAAAGSCMTLWGTTLQHRHLGDKTNVASRSSQMGWRSGVAHSSQSTRWSSLRHRQAPRAEQGPDFHMHARRRNAPTLSSRSLHGASL